MTCSKAAQTLLARTVAVAVVVGSLAAVKVPAQEALSQLRATWKSGNYETAFQGLKEFRQQPYGRLPEVDYMIGTSLCKIEGKRKLGNQYLGLILERYRLSEHQRMRVSSEREKCQTRVVDEAPLLIVFANQSERRSGVSGKSFYIPTEDVEISEPVTIKKEIAPEVFESRLFLLNQTDEAREQAKQRFKDHASYQITTSQRFLVISTTARSQDIANETHRKLEAYLDFFIKHFSMRSPRHLITVFLVPSYSQVNQLALTEHGLGLASKTIGYSFRNDMSMVGVLPSSGYFGTLAHELFHLVVRNDFGDIPPWLDEGMAALYEISELRGERVVGLPSWRLEVIQKHRKWQEIGKPDLATLIAMDWATFDAENFDGDRLRQKALNHALARYFVYFLQEQQQLRAVFRKLKQLDVAEFEDSTGQTTARLLEETFGKPLVGIDQEFRAWVKTQSR